MARERPIQSLEEEASRSLYTTSARLPPWITDVSVITDALIEIGGSDDEMIEGLDAAERRQRAEENAVRAARPALGEAFQPQSCQLNKHNSGLIFMGEQTVAAAKHQILSALPTKRSISLWFTTVMALGTRDYIHCKCWFATHAREVPCVEC